MKRRKRIAVVVAVLAVVLVAGALLKRRADAGFYDGYDASLPLAPVVRGTETRDNYTRVDFTYQSLPDSPVPTLLALPLAAEKPYPCIIFLHGIGQSKGFLDDIASQYTTKGFAIASFDQYTRGERRLASKDPVSSLLGLRRRLALNVIDTRRLVDYLQTRDDIAANRIYLIGASFGAITGCTAVAFEPRIPAAVMTYGGGDFDLLLTSDAALEQLGNFHGVVKSIVEYITAPADPVKYVARIAPRPMLFQNGKHDQLIPFAAAEALVNAAGEPKTFTVYDSDHVGMDEQQTLTVLEESVTWLQEQDRKITHTELPAKPDTITSLPDPVSPLSVLPAKLAS